MAGAERDLNVLPALFVERVFIGGNYTTLSDLDEIAEWVDKLGFAPVFPIQYKIPQEEIHDWDLRLLHNCRYAIFEVTDARGQLMEIERAHDYKVRTLLLFDAARGQEVPEQVANMLRTSGQRMEGYTSKKHRKEIIQRFLLEEDIVDEYRKTFRFECRQLVVSVDVEKDGSSSMKCEWKGLKGAVAEIPVFLEFDAPILERPNFRGDTSGLLQWQLDEPWTEGSRKADGRVLPAPGCARIEQPIDFELSVRSGAGTFSITEEQFIRDHREDPDRYEYLQWTVRHPIEELKLVVSFFDTYNIEAPVEAVYFGMEKVDQPLKPKTDAFTFDKETNVAELKIGWPRIFHHYRINWVPPKASKYLRPRERITKGG